jgi:hypothetical protein
MLKQMPILPYQFMVVIGVLGNHLPELPAL